MDVVGLEQLAPLRHPFEQEGHQRRLVAARQFGVAALEGLDVIGAVVGGQPHAGQHDAGLARLGGIEHGLQVVAQGRHRQAAQAVVAAQGDDDHVRLGPVERGAEAAAPARRGVAADAGIDDAIIQALRAQAPLRAAPARTGPGPRP
jgi:hypothetical protein